MVPAASGSASQPHTGTAIRAEDCAFPQMTEAPPESSVGERSPRQYVLDQSTQPHAPPKCHDWRLFRAHRPRPATLPLPATSPDQHRRPQVTSARLPVYAVPAPEKSPIVTPARRSNRPAPMWRQPSARQPGTHERPARRRWQPTHLRHPPASPREHTPRPHSAPQVTLDLWTIRSLPDRR